MTKIILPSRIKEFFRLLWAGLVIHPMPKRRTKEDEKAENERIVRMVERKDWH